MGMSLKTIDDYCIHMAEAMNREDFVLMVARSKAFHTDPRIVEGLRALLTPDELEAVDNPKHAFWKKPTVKMYAKRFDY